MLTAYPSLPEGSWKGPKVVPCAYPGWLGPIFQFSQAISKVNKEKRLKFVRTCWKPPDQPTVSEHGQMPCGQVHALHGRAVQKQVKETDHRPASAIKSNTSLPTFEINHLEHGGPTPCQDLGKPESGESLNR